MELFLKPRY